MKVLHICSYYLSSDLFFRLTSTLDELKIQNDIFVPLSNADREYWDRSIDNKDSVDIERILNKYDRLFYLRKGKKIFRYLEEHYDLSSYDCIHAHSLFTNGIVAKMIKDKYGIPYIVAVRNTDLNFFFKYLFMYRSTGVKIIEVSQRAKTDKTERHQNKSFIHKEKPDRMITRSGRGTGQTNNARSLANAIGA